MSLDNTFIDEAVQKALSGDEEGINSIEDRVLRAKAKAALVKAKRLAKNLLNKENPTLKSEKNPTNSFVARNPIPRNKTVVTRR